MTESYFLYLFCHTCQAYTYGEYNNDEDSMQQLVHEYTVLKPWLGLNFALLELEPKNPNGKALLDFLAVHHTHTIHITSNNPLWRSDWQ